MEKINKTEQEARKEKDLLDVLLDKENNDPIILEDLEGQTLSFEQVAVIPYDIAGQGRVLYAVLKPIDHMDGVGEDDAIVFVTDVDQYGNTILKLEEDEARLLDVFEKYYDLLEDSRRTDVDSVAQAFRKLINQRRRELHNRLGAATAVDNKDKPSVNVDTRNVPDSLRMIEDFDYGNKEINAQLIKFKLYAFGINVDPKAIQFGIDRTRYVFDFWPSKINIGELGRHQPDIKACIKTTKEVEVIAPYGRKNLVAIDVENDYFLDPHCKKALLYWLEKRDGEASIVEIQRNFHIGFNRAGRIFDTLQGLNCVEASKPFVQKPLYVTITPKDVETLFPATLGWEV